MKIISLTEDHALRIYMHPMRQRILQKLHSQKIGMTAKQLADIFSITPSSAKHHITQLESIGLVALSHTENIHGITAKYYCATDVTVNIGGGKNKNLQLAFTRQTLQQSAAHFLEYVETIIDVPEEKKNKDTFYGFCSQGHIFLREADAVALKKQIFAFLDAHRTTQEDALAIEYNVTLFPSSSKEGTP